MGGMIKRNGSSRVCTLCAQIHLLMLLCFHLVSMKNLYIIGWKAKSIQIAASINTQTSMLTAIPLPITIFHTKHFTFPSQYYKLF